MNNEFTFETIFLRPGTVLTYLRGGKMVSEILTVETEVPLISAVQNTTSIVEWAGGEATAVEPA